MVDTFELRLLKKILLFNYFLITGIIFLRIPHILINSIFNIVNVFKGI